MKLFVPITLVSTILLITSGFVYYLFASYNWGAGEIFMHLHLWLGLFFSFYIIYALPRHIKNNTSKVKLNNFKFVSYSLMGFLSITLFSGILHFIPYFSYFFTPIYYQFDTYNLISKVHLIFASLVSIFFIVHLSLHFKKVKNENF